jgi:hypothetical protein
MAGSKQPAPAPTLIKSSLHSAETNPNPHPHLNQVIIMFKKLLLCTLLAASGIAMAAPANPHQPSYGTWQSRDKSKSITLSSKGLNIVVNAPASCKRRNQWGQEISWVSGKQLRSDINESLELNDQLDDDKGSYRAEMAAVLPKIRDNARYFKILGYLSCSDGASGLIQIDANTALLVEIAPDEFYTVVRKRKP